MTHRVIYVLDTSAILAGYPLSQVTPQVTTSSVVKEVLDPRSREILETSLSIGRLKIIDPDGRWLREASIIARRVGVEDYLSPTDISVLALSLKLKSEGYLPTVLTDDYRLQRTLKAVGINFKPVKTWGIDRA